MKTMMLVEDRESGFLFLDVENAPDDTHPMDFSLAPGVIFGDVNNEDKVIWLATDTAIRVVPRETVDFENDPFDKEWPIPNCTLCLTKADYETLLS